MNYAESKSIDVSQIPVIDMGPALDDSPEGERRVAAEFRRAATEVGFFYVKNHGVPWHLAERARAAARRFFALPLDRKALVRVNANHRGFLRVGEAKMADDAEPDLKESFVWGLEVAPGDPAMTPDNPFICPNNWPTFMPEMKRAAYPYFEATLECGRRLLNVFAVSMDLPRDTFTKRWQRPIARGALVYYPPQPPELGREQFGVAPHTDYGCLTVLCQDDVGGLEVETKAGEWVAADPIEGTFVVNVGDLLTRWTNDGFASTSHRVVNKAGRERYSLVLAVDPDFETLVDPAVVCRDGEQPHYPPVRCGDYVLGRFDKAFAYRKS
jgi:isopenicillin N synthase-like dioxygenase